ncbi:MAG TPA: hypothetical protein PKE68_02360, partial [Saprospiraceae bacterium]|nr:hypothetical protein [Saprospiraceae bacterium]
GLEPLATLILEQRERNFELRAELFLTDDVPDVEAALAGARDIIAERGVSQFQIIDNRLVFREGAQLQIAGLQSFQYGTMALPEAAVNTAQVLVHKNRLYIRNQVGIIVQTF